MKNKEFAEKLEKRTKNFSIQIIRLSETLPTTPEGKVIRDQLTKSCTSIGANYREANRARSKADFKNKIGICVSEANESQYWLDIIQEVKLYIKKDFAKIHKECSELLALFTSIHNKA